MDEKEKILQDNFNEYFDLAKEALNDKKYNSATTLYFKAICAIVDLFILKKEGFVPSSHSDRFAIIREKYFEIYKILDKDFPFYQNSYTQKLDEESAEILKNDIGRIKKMFEK